jgi:hypothetical protein
MTFIAVRDAYQRSWPQLRQAADLAVDDFPAFIRLWRQNCISL